jgi:RNA polymerase sigma-70 factor (ECF subfamily)
MSSPGADLAELLLHATWLRRLARHLVRDDAEAEDVVQDTWVAATRRPPEAGRPARPWLAEVLRNFARMRRRGDHRRREREAATVTRETAEATTADDLLERMQLQRLVAELILELEEPYRSTLLLRFYEERTATEIARRDGVAAATVRWRLKEGLARLRARLDERHQGQRRAWVLLMAPMAPGLTPGLLAKGALLMQVKTKLALVVGALLLLLLAGGALWRKGAGRAPGEAPGTAATQRSPSAGGRWLVPDEGPAEPRGALDAVVVEPDGAPAAGATLALSRAAATSDAAAALPVFAGTGRADGDGRFRFSTLPPGRYTVTATARGPGLAPAVADVELADGATRTLRLVLGRGGVVVEGRLLDSGAGPVPGARVTARAAAPGGGGEPLRFFATAADERGAYALTLAPGQYALVGEADGYAAASRYLSLEASAHADLHLEPAGGIFGRVIRETTREPVAGALVQAVPTARGGRWNPAVESDADGRFRLESFGLGEFVVQARRGRLVGRAGPVAIVPAKAVTGLEVEVRAALVIAGRVLDRDGRPAAGVWVLAESHGTPGAGKAQSAPDGSYRVEGVLPGDYAVDVWTRDGGRAHGAVTVVDRDVSGVDLRITPGVVVEGQVLDGTGRPAPRVRVVAMTERGVEGEDAHYTRIATADDGGNFRMPPDVPWGVLSLRAEQKQTGIALWGPRAVEPGAVIRVSLRLEEGARLTGLVRIGDGAPAAGAKVLVVSPDGEHGMTAEAVAAADGRYSLRALAPGWAKAAASVSSAPRFEDGSARIQLAAGEEARLDLEAPRPAAIRGFARLPDGRPAAGALLLAGRTARKPWPERARRTVAGADGAFQIDDLAGGRSYHLWADLPGHSAHVADVAAGATGVIVPLTPERAPAGR